MKDVSFGAVVITAICTAGVAQACVNLNWIPAQIFFNFERDILSAQARRSAATSFLGLKGQDERCGWFSVVGHVDEAEAETQKDLDIRRAGAVGEVLLEAGFRKNSIRISGTGSDKPMVRTARGAREPQNRRVEILWHPVQGARECEEESRSPPPMCDLRICHVVLTDGLKCRVQ